MPSHGGAVFCRRSVPPARRLRGRRCVSPARRLRGRRSVPPARRLRGRRSVSPACLSRGRRSDPPACVPFRRRAPLPREFIAREGVFYAASRTRACAKNFAQARVFLRGKPYAAQFLHTVLRILRRGESLWRAGRKNFCLFFLIGAKKGRVRRPYSCNGRTEGAADK